LVHEKSPVGSRRRGFFIQVNRLPAVTGLHRILGAIGSGTDIGRGTANGVARCQCQRTGNDRCRDNLANHDHSFG
jgi:hypothetical protein